MPYSGPGDSKLPPRIKRLSTRKRRQWVNVWNRVHADCTRKNGSDCEGKAFAAANGAVNS